MAVRTERPTDDVATADVSIRPYEPRDRAGFLALHDQVFGDGSPAWFAWKYEENPYVEEVPIFVATADGAVIGARPFLAFRMRAGDNTYIGLQTSDTMVHPDFRRRGIFSRMTEASFDHYADEAPAFVFNVPNASSRPGYRKLGWEVVGELTTWYRVQNPAAFVAHDGAVDRLARLSRAVAVGYNNLRDATVDVPPDVTVVRHRTIPTSTLSALYRRRPPDAIHALRDESFVDYRFSNPAWSYAAYTARLGGTPVAGLVAGTRTHHGQTVTNLVDVVPLVGDEERDRGLAALLARCLADHVDSDVVAFRGPAIPAGLLRRFGFHSDGRLPLSRVTTRTVFLACPIPFDGHWRVAGRDLRRPSNWLPTFVEQNTS